MSELHQMSLDELREKRATITEVVRSTRRTRDGIIYTVEVERWIAGVLCRTEVWRQFVLFQKRLGAQVVQASRAQEEKAKQIIEVVWGSL